MSFPAFQEVSASMSESTRSVVKVLEAIATIMDRISPKAFSSYVISMTRNSSHVLEVGGGEEEKEGSAVSWNSTCIS